MNRLRILTILFALVASVPCQAATVMYTDQAQTVSADHTFTGNTTFTNVIAGSCTSLAANGANCTAGSAPLGVSATGAVESCFDVATQTELDTHTNNVSDAHGATSTNTPGRIALRDVAGQISANILGNVTGDASGNAGTATALAANGSNCSAGSFPLGVSAAGASESCTDAWTQAERDAWTPKIYSKTTSETVNNSTVLQNDDTFVIPFCASEVWVAHYVLLTSGNASAEVKWWFDCPTGAAMTGGVNALGFPTAATTNEGDWANYVLADQCGGTTGFYGTIAVGTAAAIHLYFRFATGSGGNLTLQWAQNSASATNTQLQAGSQAIFMRES